LSYNRSSAKPAGCKRLQLYSSTTAAGGATRPVEAWRRCALRAGLRPAALRLLCPCAMPMLASTLLAFT